MIETEESSYDQLERLENAIVNTSSALSASMGVLLDAIREFDTTYCWSAFGCRSTAQWLSWRVGTGIVAAREQVRVARALGEFRAIDAALHEGRLSYSKVRAMTRVATAANEEELLGLAELSTASQLERICRGYRTCKQMITGEEPPEAKRRHVSWRWEDGGLRLSGWLPAEEGELVRQAMTAVLDSLRQDARSSSVDDASTETPPANESVSVRGPEAFEEDASAEAHRVTEDDSAEAFRTIEDDSAEACQATKRASPSLADALLAMSETCLAGGLAALSGGERTRVVLHLGADRCCIDDGPALDLAAALRLACDAQLLPVQTDPHGRILDVGRARRSIPPAIGRALKLRDHGCQFPGCNCSRFVDAHHVVHWAQGGATKMDNLILLCRRHHGLVHEGDFSIRTAADGRFEFIEPSGRSIPRAPELPKCEGLPSLPTHRPESGHVGPWDCGWVIQGLLADDGIRA